MPGDCIRLLRAAFLAVAVWCGAGGNARAAEPIVAVVEVRGGEADAEAIRARLSEALDVPVLSVFDGSAAARGTLSIAIDHERGEARVQYRTPEATLIWTTAAIPADADPEALWIVDHAAAAVRAFEIRREPVRLTACLEVLDPWRDRGPLPRGERSAFEDAGFQLPPEVLDPFDDPPEGEDRFAGYHLPPEVIDPWAVEQKAERSRASEREDGSRLDAPGR
ncbi:MAG: hypothetical protein ACODAU_12845 [Myxococcota bacterium]